LSEALCGANQSVSVGPLIAGSPDAASWCAIHTRSNFEKRVAAELSARLIQNYLPLRQEAHQWKDRLKRIELPLFPGYVFARIRDRERDRSQILRAPGAVRVLGQSGKIEPIPDEEIESIRLLLQSSVAFFAHVFLREGARVRVRRGALQGLEGVLVRYKNQARLVLSVNLLAQSVAAEVDAADVEGLSSVVE